MKLDSNTFFILLSISWVVIEGKKNEYQDLLNKIQILQNSMERTKMELIDCHKKLESKPDTVIGQAMNTIGSCFASPPEKSFKPFVGEILKLLNVNDESELSSEVSKNLYFSAQSRDIETLRRFVVSEDIRFHEVKEILLRSLHSKDSGDLSWLGFDAVGLAGAGGKVNPYIVHFIMVSFMLCVVLIPIYLGARKRSVSLLLACICIVHVWLGEYWKLVAKKEATLAKLGPNMKNCRLDKRGYSESIRDFFTGLFNGVEDPCEEYYTAAMVDPIFEVNLLTALVESLSQLMGVLGGFGKAVGNFFTNFLAPLPLAWKIPGLVVLIIIFMLMSGYQIKTLFFSIGPSDTRSKTRRLVSISKKSLQNDEESSSEDEIQYERKRKLKDSSRTRPAAAAAPLPLPYPETEQDIFSGIKA